MAFRPQRRRLLDLSLGLGRGFLLAAPHLGIGAVHGQQICMMSAFDDPAAIAEASKGLGEAMVGINVDEIPQPHRLAERGW